MFPLCYSKTISATINHSWIHVTSRVSLASTASCSKSLCQQKEDEEDYLVQPQRFHGPIRQRRDQPQPQVAINRNLTAFLHVTKPTEAIVRRVASTRRGKLVQVGLSYDLAHAKGLVGQTDQEVRTGSIHHSQTQEAT